MTGIGEYEFIENKVSGRINVLGMIGTFWMIFDDEEYQVWKMDGKHTFSGQGQPWSYSPTEYMIMRVVRAEKDFLVARRVKSVYPGLQWRSAVKELIEEAKNMK